MQSTESTDRNTHESSVTEPTPAVGETVHYRHAGKCLAALVTDVAEGRPELLVYIPRKFPEERGLERMRADGWPATCFRHFMRDHVPHSEALPNTWHWIVDCEDHPAPGKGCR